MPSYVGDTTAYRADTLHTAEGWQTKASKQVTRQSDCYWHQHCERNGRGAAGENNGPALLYQARRGKASPSARRLQSRLTRRKSQPFQVPGSVIPAEGPGSMTASQQGRACSIPGTTRGQMRWAGVCLRGRGGRWCRVSRTPVGCLDVIPSTRGKAPKR